MVKAIEHAGAARGLLILPRSEELRIEAEAIAISQTVEVHVRESHATSAELPQTVLHYVFRTREALLLDDASGQHPFSADEYVRHHHCRSILCLPLIKQAKLTGILYLENSLTSHVFTPARIVVLKLLASQAAISLENARLYSDLQNAETNLAEAQRLSRTGSFVWRVASGDIHWSEESFRIFGYPETGKPSIAMVLDRVHPDDVDLVRGMLDRAAINQEGFDFEHRLLMPDGSVKHLHVVAHAAIDQSGSLKLVGALMDVTRTKLVQDELQKAQSELAHASRVATLGELAASIAHEVNQPLAAIVTNGETNLRWLARSPPDINEVRTGLQDMIGDARRAADVIERLRALSRKGEPQRVKLDLNQVIDEAVRLVYGEVVSHRVSLQLELAARLPSVLGDRIQLQQVIINLAINGIQAMAAVDARPRILLMQSQLYNPDQVLVRVKDSGNGISPEHADRLFDAFFTTKPKGMGMGLSICRSIIQAHDGRIWASSGGGIGAIFQFSLPAIRVM